MTVQLLSNDAFAACSDEFVVSIARTKDEIREAYRLRYQVYCVEREFEAGATGVEMDEYDEHSRHILLTHPSSGDVIGTARIVLPINDKLHDTFPMQRVCDGNVLRHLPLRSAGEISRFAISKERRMSYEATSLMRLGLVRGLVMLSQDARVTHWLAVMERSLLRLLRTTAIHFQPAGPLVEYHGIRQPAHSNLAALLHRVRLEQSATWAYLTHNGRFSPTDEQDSLVA